MRKNVRIIDLEEKTNKKTTAKAYCKSLKKKTYHKPLNINERRNVNHFKKFRNGEIDYDANNETKLAFILAIIAPWNDACSAPNGKGRRKKPVTHKNLD